MPPCNKHWIRTAIRPSSSDKSNADSQFDAEDSAEIVSESESDDENSGGQEDPADSDGESDSRLVINIQYARNCVSTVSQSSCTYGKTPPLSSSTSAIDHPH